MKKIITTSIVLPLITTSLIAEESTNSKSTAVSTSETVVLKELNNGETLKREVIEVCFVLDTTGSMGGLIQGAKQKIWSIANEIAQRRPTPSIRFSLVGYRDRGDSYITQVFDMTDDLDNIHAELMKFAAAGGGDGPESVNQALHEAITKVKWSKNPKTKKIVFLVGDAPPHMDYLQEVQYPDICKMAVQKGITINTIQCGSMASCTPIWKQIAEQGNGSYVALPQSGGVTQITAPQDKEIAELSTQIYKGAISYGSAKQRALLETKRDNAIALAANDSASNSKKNECQNINGAGAYRAFSGNDDLVTEWSNKVVTLDNLKREKLPEALRELSNEELAQTIQDKIEERKKLQERINKLHIERAKFIEQNEKEKPATEESKAFDTEVERMLKNQLK